VWCVTLVYCSSMHAGPKSARSPTGHMVWRTAGAAAEGSCTARRCATPLHVSSWAVQLFPLGCAAEGDVSPARRRYQDRRTTRAYMYRIYTQDGARPGLPVPPLPCCLSAVAWWPASSAREG
jgi:hypothetical protein